jgi:hypothetical protein
VLPPTRAEHALRDNFDLVAMLDFSLSWDECRSEAVPGELHDLRVGKAEALLHRAKVVQEVSAEVRRVVGVNGYLEAELEESVEDVGADVWKHPEPDV